MIRLFGAILLIAGSCIGAGMLALPVVTGLAGFVPSVVVFIACWLFMMTTGLLLLEVNLWLGEEISIVSMAHRTLGKWGGATAWVTFLFLFYCLLVAYASASGTLVSDFLAGSIGWQAPVWFGSLLFTVVIGYMVYLGTGAVDQLNRFLMLGLIVAYAALVVIGLPHVEPELIGERDWSPILYAVPVILVSFGFHNMIPSLSTYLHCNRRQLRWAVILGSTLPLIAYLLFEWIILGVVPAEELSGGGDDLATQMLRTVTDTPWVAIAAQYFAFFAILTSFLAQGLSLRDFIADGFGIVHPGRWTRAWLTLLAVLPPFLFGVNYSNVFISAIEVAGGIGAMILFGILPCLMVWVGRYRAKEIPHKMVWGGRPLLILLILIASLIVIGEAMEQFGWL